jgi:hypothetical protein
MTLLKEHVNEMAEKVWAERKATGKSWKKICEELGYPYMPTYRRAVKLSLLEGENQDEGTLRVFDLKEPEKHKSLPRRIAELERTIQGLEKTLKTVITKMESWDTKINAIARELT